MTHPLDPRLCWAPRWQYDGQDTALQLLGETVAYLDVRIDDGRWFAQLRPSLAPFAGSIQRFCTDEAAGRRGCEAWAMRHLEHLLGEVEAARARRPRRVA